eukprot:363433-Chlamydomonas_euryale.AAC.26
MLGTYRCTAMALHESGLAGQRGGAAAMQLRWGCLQGRLSWARKIKRVEREIGSQTETERERKGGRASRRLPAGVIRSPVGFWHVGARPVGKGREIQRLTEIEGYTERGIHTERVEGDGEER